jgi:hypothetical protein
MAEGAPSDSWDTDALRALEARLDQAAAAAERLLAETDEIPRNGWQRRSAGDGVDGDDAGDRFGGWLDPADGELLLALLAGLRDRIPTELQQRLVAALRELVLALRALIEWCAQRAQRRKAAPRAVQDIPIL